MAIPQHIDDAPSKALAVALPPELLRLARTTLRWRPGCEVVVLRDGTETYSAMLAAIRGATTTICMETYILAQDVVGDRFKEALIERATAGVTVRLLYDAVGSFGITRGWLSGLRDAGVHVVEFNPIAPWRARFRLSHRDHRKCIVIDDSVAFTGGLNIAKDYAGVEQGGVGWHDMHCRVRGAVVGDLARGFRRTWVRAGGVPYPSPRPPHGEVVGPAYVRLLENMQRRQRTAIRRAYLYVIKQARKRVLIQNAYFLPDLGLRRALVGAVNRGVEVAVLVPGHSDVRLVEWASLYVFRLLVRRGVKVYRWAGPMMHAKTATVDGTWSTIGSYNFDAQSRFNNLELTVEILDPAVASELEREFDNDAPTCAPFVLDTWKKLPWYTKAMAWIAFRLRRLL